MSTQDSTANSTSGSSQTADQNASLQQKASWVHTPLFKFLPFLVLPCLSLVYAPLDPNFRAQSSYSFNPSEDTLGRIYFKLFSKSSKLIGRICSVGVERSLSPNDLNGPIAESLAKAVISLPLNPFCQFN